MTACELCEKREATITLKVCDGCHNDFVVGKEPVLEGVNVESEREE